MPMSLWLVIRWIVLFMDEEQRLSVTHLSHLRNVLLYEAIRGGN